MILIYMALGYWATGKTIYANSTLYGTWNAIFMRKMCMGAILGWALIPIAVYKSFK